MLAGRDGGSEVVPTTAKKPGRLYLFLSHGCRTGPLMPKANCNAPALSPSFTDTMGVLFPFLNICYRNTSPHFRLPSFPSSPPKNTWGVAAILKNVLLARRETMKRPTLFLLSSSVASTPTPSVTTTGMFTFLTSLCRSSLCVAGVQLIMPILAGGEKVWSRQRRQQ
jgi:hypothetical protein